MKNFYFYDLPRTGGTSFKRWCKNRKGIKRVYFGEGKGWHHVPFESVEKLAPGKIWTFTLLRNPIEHTASLYAKIRIHKHAYRTKLLGLNFNQWIRGIFEVDMVSSPAPWGFSMVKFFDPVSENLDVAIKNIESMDFVGFTDRLNSDINLMFKKIGVEDAFNGPRLNVARRSFEVTEGEKKVIRIVRADDFKLVNHFRKKRGLSLYE